MKIEKWYVYVFIYPEPDYIEELYDKKGSFKTKEEAEKFATSYFGDIYNVNLVFKEESDN